MGFNFGAWIVVFLLCYHLTNSIAQTGQEVEPDYTLKSVEELIKTYESVIDLSKGPHGLGEKCQCLVPECVATHMDIIEALKRSSTNTSLSKREFQIYFPKILGTKCYMCFLEEIKKEEPKDCVKIYRSMVSLVNIAAHKITLEKEIRGIV